MFSKIGAGYTRRRLRWYIICIDGNSPSEVPSASGLLPQKRALQSSRRSGSTLLSATKLHKSLNARDPSCMSYAASRQRQTVKWRARLGSQLGALASYSDFGTDRLSETLQAADNKGHQKTNPIDRLYYGGKSVPSLQQETTVQRRPQKITA